MQGVFFIYWGVRLVAAPEVWQFQDMNRFRDAGLLTLVLALLSSAAVAAEGKSSVTVRATPKEDYTRVVLEWDKIPKYTFTQKEDTLELNFMGSKKMTPDLSGLSAVPRIVSSEMEGDHLLKIDVTKGQSIRQFAVGNRIVIDIKGEAKAVEREAANNVTETNLAPIKPQDLASAIEPAQGDKEAEEPKVEKKTEGDHKPNLLEKHQEEKAALKKDAEETKPEEVTQETTASPKPETSAGEALKPFQVLITDTNALPMAVFERNGYLWVAEDKEGVLVPPSVEGEHPNKNSFYFESILADGFSLFRMKIPAGYSVTSEGGGLVWKLHFISSQGASHSTSVEPERVQQEGLPSPAGELKWPALSAHRIATYTDPDAGDELQIVFVNEAKDKIIGMREYPEISILSSIVGMALAQKADDVVVKKMKDGVYISRPEGLTLSDDTEIFAGKDDIHIQPHGLTSEAEPMRRIFDFEKWHIGEIADLPENQRVIMSGLSDLTDAKKAENLISLGKMMLSFDYAHEALGYFDLAAQMVPDLESNSEFTALRGVAEGLAGRYKSAFSILKAQSLNGIPEIDFWKAYTLAGLDDWQQAAKILPEDISLLSSYPVEIRNPLGLTLAEVALREGNKTKAEKILKILEQEKEHMNMPHMAALSYLQGEYARQTGKSEETKELWGALSTGPDDLYRAKARFALSSLQYGAKEITIDKAIDNLEGLRYAWRGDDLETSINYNLAKLYIDKGEPIKALTLMRLSTSIANSPEFGKKIDAEMRSTFRDLFTPEKIKNITPIDAMTVYNEFADLIPAGPDGYLLARQLAERLVDADLLVRAANLLKAQVDGKLQGAEAARVAIRLASIQIEDLKPNDAMTSLTKAETFLSDIPAEEKNPLVRDIALLRAKAQALNNKTDQSFATLSLLPQDENVLRMRADIAWKAKKWQPAADALEQLVQLENISLTRPLTEEQADLILNWAIALYLADNRYVLANLRERYSDSMAQTSKATKFEVVTRPRQAAMLADRETIRSIISETELFKNFLDGFKGNPAATVKPSDIKPPKGSDPNPPSTETETPVQNPADIPEELRKSPLLKTDGFSGD